MKPFCYHSFDLRQLVSFAEIARTGSFRQAAKTLHIAQPLRVEALADHVHMSPRNFARIYAQTRGRSPAKAVEAIRLDAARRRLEETTVRVETIAEDCGFSGEEQMRLAFIRTLGVPPRDYRKRFASTQS